MRHSLLLGLALLSGAAFADPFAVASDKPDKAIAEPAVRSMLKDPDSAKFTWPYDFTYTWYKPTIFDKKAWYWVVCGTVNAKNGYGGYAGETAVLVMVKDGAVAKVMIDDPSGYAHVAPDCAKIGEPVG